MVISGHFDQRWILAGVPGATECQPGWCHSQLCRSQRSVTLNSSSSSSCSNTLPLWYILQIKHLRWYLDPFDTWEWEWVGFVLRLKRLQQRTKGLWLVIGHRTGFDAIGRVEWARLMLVAGYDLVSTLHQTPCKANKLFYVALFWASFLLLLLSGLAFLPFPWFVLISMSKHVSPTECWCAILSLSLDNWSCCSPCHWYPLPGQLDEAVQGRSSQNMLSCTCAEAHRTMVSREQYTEFD